MHRRVIRPLIIAGLIASLVAGCSLFGEGFQHRPSSKTAAAAKPAPPPAPVYPPPVATQRFVIDAAKDDVVGELQVTVVGPEDTFSDIARRFNVGYEEMVRANPGIDPWLPKPGSKVIVPTRFVLPNAPREGIVINVAAMRLFYFAPRKKGEPLVVYTYPIGIGRVGWATPQGETKITRKVEDPVWRPTPAILKEHAENGDPLPEVVPAGPDNPLGNRAMYLAWPTYLIHGTNKPYGVGIRSSHGCIRLYPEDILQLYGTTPVGSRVRVVNQPFVFGWHGDSLYLQAYGELEDDPRDFAKAEKKLLSRELSARIQKELKQRNETIDWQEVATLTHQPRGIPVSIAGASVTLDALVAQAPVVANRVPDGATWDGVSGLPIDARTMQEMLSDSDPAAPPNAPAEKPRS
jgi:L,D-transpeptidase ErfK/SrfK